MSKNKLSTKATTVYNTLLELNWSEPYLTLEHIQAATGLGRSKLAPVLAELIETFTPKVKGVAYGYPLDYYTFDEWVGHKLDIN